MPKSTKGKLMKHGAMKKTIICILGAILLLLAVGVGVFVYGTKYKVTLIDESLSPNEEYALMLFSVGEPDFPFGNAHGKIILTKNGEKISQTKIDLAQDGCQISKDNWSVVWCESYARVTLHAEEQTDEHWQMFFDGQVKQLSASYSNTNGEQPNEKPLSISLKAGENDSGESIFLVSADDFVDSFNCIYGERNSSSYLKPFDEWTQLSENTPFYGYNAICRRFSADERDWQKPTMSIFTSENESEIYEIMLTFNDHGYQEEKYKEFREMCLCALSVALPKLADKEVDSLYSELYEQTEKNIRGDNFTDDKRRDTEVMYRNDCVGLYGYYGVGTANICIVPLCENPAEPMSERDIESRCAS